MAKERAGKPLGHLATGRREGNSSRGGAGREDVSVSLKAGIRCDSGGKEPESCPVHPFTSHEFKTSSSAAIPMIWAPAEGIQQPHGCFFPPCIHWIVPRGIKEKKITLFFNQHFLFLSYFKIDSKLSRSREYFYLLEAVPLQEYFGLGAWPWGKQQQLPPSRLVVYPYNH